MNAEAAGRPVVVGIDDSEGALAAVRWAARYADEIGAPLRVVYAMNVTDTRGRAVSTPVEDVSTGPRRPGCSGDRLLAAGVVEAVRSAPHLQVSVRPASEAPVEALTDASLQARLLVIGSRDRGRWATRFDSVAARVVATAHSPVVVVRGNVEPSGPVVVAVDGSDGCEPALRFAFSEAARRRCPLVAVHAWHKPLVAAGARLRAAAVTTGGPAGGSGAMTAWRSLTDTVAKHSAAFPDVVVHERLLQGYPDEVVVGETAGAALAVVGSRGRRPLAALLLGSTSRTLVHRSRCPVAVVRNGSEAERKAPC